MVYDATSADCVSKLDAKEGEFKCSAPFKLPRVIFN